MGFLAAGALAVVTGLTAPLRPDMAANEGEAPLRPLLAALACTAVCAILVVIAPEMLRDTPLAIVMGCAIAHAAVTAGGAAARRRLNPSRRRIA